MGAAHNASRRGHSLAIQLSQQTSRRIQAEHHDLIGILMADQQPVSGSRQGEVPWCEAQACLKAHKAQQAAGRIDAEDHKAVVPAIGGIQPLATGVNLDFGGGGVSVEVSWNSGNRLKLCQYTQVIIPGEGCDGACVLADQIDKPARWVNGDMARA